MKRVATVVVLIAVLVMASAALAKGSLSGTFKTKIGPGPLGGQLKGTWTIKFKNGAYTVTDNGSTAITGAYTIKGTKVSLGHEHGPDACSTTGTYSFKITGSKLKFTRVKDSTTNCAGRVAVLAGSFTKVS
jgi:hypothetical protein